MRKAVIPTAHLVRSPRGELQARRCPYCRDTVRPIWPNSTFCRCPTCRLVLRLGNGMEEALSTLYRESWKIPGDCTQLTGGTGERLAGLYARRLAGSLGRRDLAGMQVLDFGCGRGAMMNACSNLGADVWGVDPFSVSYLKQQGFRQVYGSLGDLPGLRFDLIISVDVIEHLPHPWDQIREFRYWLAPSGYLFLATPNARSLNAVLSGRNWRELHNPGHVVLFTPEALTSLLEREGYCDVRRLKWLITYGRGPRRLLHHILQLANLEGELRIIARRA